MRLPLYLKILAWFFLNLLLLTGGLIGFAQWQFGLNLGALLTGRAGDQVEKMSRLLLDEMRGQGPEQWSAVLRRYEKAYGVSLYVFGGRGEWLAGGVREVPADVMAQLRRPPPRPPMAGGPPPGPPEPPLALVQTTNPLRYWALVRVDLPGPRGMPGTLVIESTTLNAGGLFFDARPWLALLGGAVLLSALFWLPFVSRMTGAIQAIAAATGRFAEGDFSRPARVKRRDEIGALGLSVNRMATRLDGYVTGQRRFLGDIAHELCAPLARLQMALGILESRADVSQRERLADLREEVDHMAGLVNELLSFSKAALGTTAVQIEAVNLRGVVQRAVQREASGALVVVGEALKVLVDADLLERAVANLLRNAVRHAGQSGAIEVTAERAGAIVLLRVSDCGPGVPAEMLEQIFDPFFRVDAARTRESGGTGLGLAIVKTCVTSCGGEVSARNREPSGLEVTLRLRAAPGQE